MLKTVIMALVAFVFTNIDDLLLNTLFFSEVKSRRKRFGVVIGKYLGSFILVLLGILGAFGVGFFEEKYLAILGIIPITLGFISFFKREKDGEEPDGKRERRAFGTVARVALVTLSDGADNIGIYIPLFAGFEIWQFAVVIIIFLVMVSVFCLLGMLISSLPRLERLITKHKRFIIPITYILIGVYVILKNLL